LLALDAWRRSGLPAGDFAPLVGVSKHTLYAWERKFDAQGPAGLLDAPRDGPACFGQFDRRAQAEGPCALRPDTRMALA